jgi:aryl-alcohol dehydrogenase-like predicted oxidoreductase
VEDEILPAVRALGIGFVAYSPLGRGFLTGAFRAPEDIPEGDYRKNNPRFQGDNFAKNLRLVDVVNDIARAKNATASQIALAWLLSRGDDVVPIPGTKRVSYLEENARAVEIELEASDLDRIETTFPFGITSGTRYHEQAMAALGR